MSADLIAFVTARIDEDEQAARAATAGPWKVDDETYAEAIYAADGFTTVVAGGRWGGEASVFNETADARHIARHDPARVLRQVAANRRTLARHQPVEVWAGWAHLPPGDPGARRVISVDCSTCRDGNCDTDYDATCTSPDWPCPEVRDLAAAYADHPDYRQEWAP